MPEVILSAQDLVKYYPIKKGVLRRRSARSRPSTA